MTLNELKDKARSVSDKIFGRTNPVTGPVIKLKEEADELIECLQTGDDPSFEFADCFLLIVDAYRKHYGDDVDMQKLIDDSSKKLDIVVGRKWGMPTDEGVYQHIKEDEELSMTLPDEEVKLPNAKKIEPQPPVLESDFNLNKPEGFNEDQLQRVYDEISLDVAYELTNETTRKRIYHLMKEKLPYYEIKCDEENNPPEVVDQGQIWVRVTDPNTKTYIDLIF